MMTGRVMGKIIQSLCSDIHLQAFKLGGSTQKTIRKLCQAVVGEVPGDVGNQTAFHLPSLPFLLIPTFQPR